MSINKLGLESLPKPSIPIRIKSILAEYHTFLAVVVVLYCLPLFTKAEFGPLRTLLFIITELLIFGIFALSFEFQLGRAGLLNFGQAAFFGLGAYMMAFHLRPEIFPEPISLLFGFVPFPFSLISAIAVGVLVGIVMGATTNRMKGTAFAFIALALAMVIFEIFNMPGMQKISGGETGLSIGSGNPYILGDWFLYLVLVVVAFIVVLLFASATFLDFSKRKRFSFIRLQKYRSALKFSETKEKSLIRIVVSFLLVLIPLLLFLIIIAPNVLSMYSIGLPVHFKIPNTYYVVLTISILCYLFVKRVIKSPFGRTLAAISQNEERAEALGYNVFAYKITAIAISGGLAALAGALFVPYKVIIDPIITLGVGVTIDAMIYTIIGGLGTILGPFLGAGVVRFSELRLVEILEAFNIPGEFWLVFLGIIYVIIVLFFPWGIVGTIKLKSYKIKDKLYQYFQIRDNDYWIFALFFSIVTIVIMLSI
ncbi:MAG: branched-chain amino acid ABC transporter permease [Candidatus Hodarchaeales archaeon]